MKRITMPRWDLVLGSIYAASLFVGANHSSASSFSLVWWVRSSYRSWRYPNLPMGIDDHHGVMLTAFILVWTLAALVVVALHVLANLRPTMVLTRFFVGVVAVLGLPLTHLYTGHNELPFVYVELAISFAVVASFSFGRRLFSFPAALILLLLHFALWTVLTWTSFFPGLFLVWPGWFHYFHHDGYVQLIYVGLAFGCALLWIRSLPTSETLWQARIME